MKYVSSDHFMRADKQPTRKKSETGKRPEIISTGYIRKRCLPDALFTPNGTCMSPTAYITNMSFFDTVRIICHLKKTDAAFRIFHIETFSFFLKDLAG